MSRLLHIDSSARSGQSGRDPHGSHTRRLSARFIERWHAQSPQDAVVYRDVGVSAPKPVDGEWVHAAFTPAERRRDWMVERLAESDAIIDEALASDIIVAGVPMYNFGPPAQFKAYIDNLVRVGRTFGFDRSRPGEPYWPMLAGQEKQLVILTSRGDYGYGPGGRLEERNHVENSVRTAFEYIGIDISHVVAIEYDEFADHRVAASIAAAEAQVDRLVEQLLAERVRQAA
jgi:FMN-dependent NADH-azoreductase